MEDQKVKVKKLVRIALVTGAFLTFILAQLTYINGSNAQSNENKALRSANEVLKQQVEEFSEVSACRSGLASSYNEELAKGFVLMSEGFALIEEGLISVAINDDPGLLRLAEKLDQNKAALYEQNVLIKQSAERYANSAEICVETGV